MGIRKRRIYDITNILEGAKIIKKIRKNTVVLEYFKTEENIIDEKIIERQILVDKLINHEKAYLTKNDIKRKKIKSIVIKASASTELDFYKNSLNNTSVLQLKSPEVIQVISIEKNDIGDTSLFSNSSTSPLVHQHKLNAMDNYHMSYGFICQSPTKIPFPAEENLKYYLNEHEQ